MDKRRLRAYVNNEFYIEDVHKYRVDKSNFIIYVGGDPEAVPGGYDENYEPGVEYHMADRFEMNMNILSSVDSSHPILINLASCGGYWDEGMQMFSAILTCPNPVTILATKWARSMTSIIPLAADKFILRPPVQYMFHYGSYGFWGIEQEADTSDVERRKTCEMMKRIYIARLREQGCFKHLNEKQIRHKLESEMKDKIDVWLSAQEAKDWGFVDEIQGILPAERATEINHKRRQKMFEVVSSPIDIEIRIK